jgi:class 3 adenylate cyclase
MLSDMVNFTLMTERLGDLKARDVVREHNRIIREQIAANQGYEVDTAGDGFLVAFKSARFGLACAIAIQRALAARNASAQEPIDVRIGLHTGEALRDADKFFGRTVILAARIGSQAKGGEILVSSLIKELSASVGDVAFGDAREVQLKGIALPQRVVEVKWR